mmetsp:Transcript_69312/g.122876  ORF Transcript_69312/g.122876 Transcript_69312/m.122876 type:complete len:239 (-) Transcript_69312:400-1116(-)
MWMRPCAVLAASSHCLHIQVLGSQRRDGHASCELLGHGVKKPTCNFRLPLSLWRPVLTQAAVTRKIVPFFSEQPGEPYREFSNWYEEGKGFDFVIPAYAWKSGFPRSVWCKHAEKAIMLTKAALMEDLETFKAIEKTQDPETVKALGRKVTPFKSELWAKHLEETAFEIVRQKFEADEGLQQVLLSTGDAIICEASPWDRIWGIGIAVGDPRALEPAQWQGRNVLGEALMRVRDHLRR